MFWFIWIFLYEQICYWCIFLIILCNIVQGVWKSISILVLIKIDVLLVFVNDWEASGTSDCGLFLIDSWTIWRCKYCFINFSYHFNWKDGLFSGKLEDQQGFVTACNKQQGFVLTNLDSDRVNIFFLANFQYMDQSAWLIIPDPDFIGIRACDEEVKLFWQLSERYFLLDVILTVFQRFSRSLIQ